jgi:hypothetical protein
MDGTCSSCGLPKRCKTASPESVYHRHSWRHTAVVQPSTAAADCGLHPPEGRQRFAFPVQFKTCCSKRIAVEKRRAISSTRRSWCSGCCLWSQGPAAGFPHFPEVNLREPIQWVQKEAASDRYGWPVLILAAVALAVVAETFLIAKVSPLLTGDEAM